jgi:hypothetical protein
MIMDGGCASRWVPDTATLHSSVSWKETEDRITRSAMSAEEKHFDNGTTLVRYRVDFRYEYRVQRRRYESSRINVSAAAVDNELLDRAGAEGVVGRYPAGERVADRRGDAILRNGPGRI